MMNWILSKSALMRLKQMGNLKDKHIFVSKNMKLHLLQRNTLNPRSFFTRLIFREIHGVKPQVAWVQPAGKPNPFRIIVREQDGRMGSGGPQRHGPGYPSARNATPYDRPRGGYGYPPMPYGYYPPQPYPPRGGYPPRGRHR